MNLKYCVEEWTKKVIAIALEEEPDNVHVELRCHSYEEHLDAASIQSI